MLTYIFLLILISTILSYLILEFIYRILFKSKKKVSKFLVFLGSIGLIIFYYTPYSYYLEPSFYEFKEMCKLNELPNNEQKYNKILSYFDTDLDRLDWEELNKTKKIFNALNSEQITYRFEILSRNPLPDDKYRYEYIDKNRFVINNAPKFEDITAIIVDFYTLQPHIDRNNIADIKIFVYWNTKRYSYFFSSTSYEWYKVKDYEIWCDDIRKRD